jgi:NarL family two-component system response regulator LiaR
MRVTARNLYFPPTRLREFQRLVFPQTISDHPAMTRTIVLWAAVLAASAFALQWLEYQYVVRVFSREITIGIIGTACAAGGVWLGWKLTTRSAPALFTLNAAAQSSLGLTGQEMRVLERLAAGESNKEIGRTLGLSPNTVKTHTANLYAKLEVGSRGLAVSKARSLHLLP